MNIGITGHQQLPTEESWKWVRSQIDELFRSYSREDPEAYSSLAAGADQTFAAVAIESGRPLHVIIPCTEYEKAFKSKDALERFRAMRDQAVTVRTGAFNGPSEEAFLQAGKDIVEGVDLLVTVWDGQPARGKGGTEDIVEFAQQKGLPILHINPVARTVRRL